MQMRKSDIAEFLEKFIALTPTQRVVVRDAVEGLTQKRKKICPICGHEFQGNGWDGTDAHWRARHEDLCSYEAAWEIILGMETAKEVSS